jgi:N-carbamoyl-L-amino-acid hydrolase
MNESIDLAAADRLAARVREDRLWQRHEAQGAIGATAKGGVKRLALSEEDARSQRLLIDWALARGYTCRRDPIGNLWIRRAGLETKLDPVVTGSHLDSQPTGGKYDGAYGVLAGLEVLEALDDAGIQTLRPIELVAWMNEEGSRFLPGAMGSGTWVGAFELSTMLARTDSAGVVLGEALRQLNGAVPLPTIPLASIRPAAYLEAHIEQGPRLESASARIGAVTGIQGIRRFVIEVGGEEAHAGTTPRAHRRDAVLAAVALIGALEHEAQDAEDVLRFTVGKLQVWPNSPNTVPSRVQFTIDLRHPDDATLDQFTSRIETLATQHAGARGCTIAVEKVSAVRPVVFAEAMVQRVRQAAQAEGLPQMSFPSGAGHDAMYMNRICPTGMIFVPCLKGISHNESESASAADLAAGARVLARTMLDLAQSR